MAQVTMDISTEMSVMRHYHASFRLALYLVLWGRTTMLLPELTKGSIHTIWVRLGANAEVEVANKVAESTHSLSIAFVTQAPSFDVSMTPQSCTSSCTGFCSFQAVKMVSNLPEFAQGAEKGQNQLLGISSCELCI